MMEDNEQNKDDDEKESWRDIEAKKKVWFGLLGFMAYQPL